MSSKKTTHRAFDMPDTPPRKGLRRRIGATFVSGCLVLTTFPALALAQPNGMPEQPDGNFQPTQMQMPSQQSGEFQQNAPGNFGSFDQGIMAGENQGFDQGFEQGDSGNMPQPPSQGDTDQTQPPSGDGQMQAPDTNMNGQPNQNVPGGEQGMQPGQNGPVGEQGMQPGQAPGMEGGMQAPLAPEQVRSIVERLYSIFNIDAEANPIDQIMEKLGFGGQNGAFGQNGQMGQPGQMGDSQNGQPGQPGQNDGMSNAPTSYDAANRLESDASGASYTSSANSENAILVDGKTVTLNGATVNKTGDSNSESADFYGINAAILANNGANLTITDTTVTTDGAHANGVFSYGSGTSISISDSTITTTGNNSGGLMTTGGASLNATNLTVNTSGNSSAAIRTDRGGGTVTATQGSYSTSGVGSPAVYSTADITVNDATLSADNSEAVVIEGGNSVTLNNVNATGNNAKLNGQSTEKTNVLIYQSMSGDASEGSSQFNMTGGTLTSLTGSMFHVTNVTTTINLSGVTLVKAADSDVLLSAKADSWGTSDKNGGKVTMNLSNQVASGNIICDSISSVALNLSNSSSYSGAISNDGTVNVKIAAGCTWNLTGDSYVTSLENAGTINLNGYKLYVDGVLYNA